MSIHEIFRFLIFLISNDHLSKCGLIQDDHSPPRLLHLLPDGLAHPGRVGPAGVLGVDDVIRGLGAAGLVVKPVPDIK